MLFEKNLVKKIHLTVKIERNPSAQNPPILGGRGGGELHPILLHWKVLRVAPVAHADVGEGAEGL